MNGSGIRDIRFLPWEGDGAGGRSRDAIVRLDDECESVILVTANKLESATSPSPNRLHQKADRLRRFHIQRCEMWDRFDDFFDTWGIDYCEDYLLQQKMDTSRRRYFL